VIDGFSGPQRFFIGFAQVWRGAALDGRSPPALADRPTFALPLSHFSARCRTTQAFYDAFDIKPGDSLYRKPAGPRAGVVSNEASTQMNADGRKKNGNTDPH